MSALRSGTDAYRADDAPPYFTIFVVGHMSYPACCCWNRTCIPPSWVHMVTWVPVTAVDLGLVAPDQGGRNQARNGHFG